MRDRSRPAPDPELWETANAAFARGDLTGCLRDVGRLMEAFGPAPHLVQLSVKACLRQGATGPALRLVNQGLMEQPRCGKLWEFAAAVWMQTRHWDVARACLHKAQRENLRLDEAPGIWQRLEACPTGGPSAPKPWRHLLQTPCPPPSLGACLIVRNEERLLPACLTSLTGCDEIVVVDTGSTDATLDIAGRFGARTGHFAWIDDFAAARNAALDLCQADWILVIDADEVLADGDVAAVRGSVDDQGGGRQILAPVISNLGGPTGILSHHRVGRLFARKAGRRFIGRIHEQVVDADGSPLLSCGVNEWHLDHYGYRPEAQQQDGKQVRNQALLKRWIAECPQDGDAYYYLASTYLAAGQAKEALPLFRRAAEVSLPGQFRDLNHLGLMTCLERLGDWAGVVQAAADRTVRTFPDYWLILARGLAQVGRRADAIEACRHVMAMPADQRSSRETEGARTWQPRELLDELQAGI